MSYKAHAERELKALGYKLDDPEDGPNKWIVENLLELLEVFSKQGHSRSSAPYCIKMFAKLAAFEPLSPLTGEDAEWVEVGSGVFQNSRCSHVFQQANRFNGQAYDINGKVFRYPDGGCFTNGESRVPVTFPYTPTTEYVDVPEREQGGEAMADTSSGPAFPTDSERQISPNGYHYEGMSLRDWFARDGDGNYVYSPERLRQIALDVLDAEAERLRAVLKDRA